MIYPRDNMKISGILLLISTIFASSDMANPNTYPEYVPAAFSETPTIDEICTELSANRHMLDKNDLISYQCLCNEMEYENQLFSERSSTLREWFKKEIASQAKEFSKTFADGLIYIRDEFKKQEPIINYLTNENPTDFPMITDDPISGFIIENMNMPIDEFTPKYSQFLLNHILQKYKVEFEKLDFFNIPKLLKINFFILECEAKHKFQTGDFITIVDAIKFSNVSVTLIFEGFSIQETSENHVE